MGKRGKVAAPSNNSGLPVLVAPVPAVWSSLIVASAAKFAVCGGGSDANEGTDRVHGESTG